MPGIGHNRGPATDDGVSWRRFAWAQARAALLPNLPIEVVRLRVNRARDLGLPYRTYASVRASTGRDVIGFLFSNNALQVLKAGQALPDPIRAALSGLRGCDRTAVVHRPLDPDLMLQGAALDAAHPAPAFTATWVAMRDQIRAVLRDRGGPADGYLVIGEPAWERDWAEAGRTAGFLAGGQYFGAGA